MWCARARTHTQFGAHTHTHTFSSYSILLYYYYKSRHLQHTSARQPLSFCTWSSEPHRRFAPRVHEAAATRTSYVTVHTCTMRVEKVCKVREEPAPCLITAQGATGCDGVWQCVAGRLSDKVLAPRSTVMHKGSCHVVRVAGGVAGTHSVLTGACIA